MKLFSILFLTIFLGKGCDSEQQQDMKMAVVTYTANTRGFYQRITIQDQNILVSKERGDQTVTTSKISDADWKTLVTEFSKIKLDDLPNLKAPTEKRFYDGAAIGDLKVAYKGQTTYESSAFDHGTPPAEIAGLVNKMVSLAKE
jgi:hypothetical protein